MTRGPSGGGRKIRILHIVQSMGYGGLENRIRRLAEGLDPERFGIHVVTLREAKGGGFALPDRVGRALYPIPPGWHPGKVAGLARLIRRIGADVVHTHNWGTMFYGVLAGRLALGPRVVHGEHGLNADDLDQRRGKRVLLQSSLARLCHAIIPVNAVIAEQIASDWGLPPSSLRIIPNGVDVERFRPVPVPPAEFTLGTVARLDAVKDLGRLIEAVRLLKEGGTPARAILVGDGPLKADLLRQAEAAGVADRVDFAGAASDVHLRYGAFTAMVNSSVYEGMSNTLLEAMACGLPLIVSRVAGNRAWLREGENALFFEPGDAAGLAARARELRSDPAAAAAMGERNRRRALAEYDNRGFLKAYADAYREILGRKRDPGA